MHARTRQLLLPLSALTLLVPRLALAEPEFPRAIKRQLGLDYEPPCSICHQLGKTGDGTPIEPFAWSMRHRGLTTDDPTLSPALTSDEQEVVDSDADGIPDTVELRNGTDPNSAANGCIIPEGTTLAEGQCTPWTVASPELGCAISAPGRRFRAGPVTLLAALAWLASRRRRAPPSHPRRAS